MTNEIPKHFWARVNKSGPVQSHYSNLGQCWEWQRSKVDGYGNLAYQGKVVKAHRMSWFLKTGTWPQECVLHKCDNRLCVNPEHLFLGTRGDNNRDRNAKGRHSYGESRRRALMGKMPKGEDQGSAKLTDQIVREIRSSSDGLTVLAQRYRVSSMTIWCAKTRRSWKHIP